MGIFSRKKNVENLPVAPGGAGQAELAMTVLNAIADGVIIVGPDTAIKMINPAAATMIGVAPEGVLNVGVAGVMRFENGEGMMIEDAANQVLSAVTGNQPFETRGYVLVNAQGQKRPVAVRVTPTGDVNVERIITFRDIAKELEEEGEQAEFVSTASHEMRTPVASIEGFLGLALNPQTATIDDRARKYLTQAHESSQHLGRLFQELLDVTKLDDHKMKVHLQPIEMVSAVRSIAEGQVPAMAAKKISYNFGMADDVGSADKKLDQVVYGSVDVDFLREIMNNIIENAIKYTGEGGAIWVNVRGDGDRALINVTDTGMGIAPDDLKHIFQKFYRVDNSQTREIGGTGLGLYLVKQRTEAMGGKVWAESSFGQGSTFYVSLPRLTVEEYERRRQIMANQAAMGAATMAAVQPGAVAPTGVVAAEAAAAPAAPAVDGAVAAPVAGAAPAVAPAAGAVAAPVAGAVPAGTDGTVQNGVVNQA